MTLTELKESWEVTIGHLNAATRWLPENLCSKDKRLGRFHEYLSHNELELAADELVSLGEDLDLPESFWDEINKARTNMGLL